MVWTRTRISIPIAYCNFVFVVFTFTYPQGWRIVEAQQFPIGIVFDIQNPELHSAYTFAMEQLSPKTDFPGQAKEMLPQIEYISASGDWCQTSHAIEKHICKNGVVALVSALVSGQHLEEFFSVSNGYRMPVVAPWIPVTIQKAKSLDFGIQPAALRDAVMDMISHFGHKNFIYLYSGLEGLHRLQTYYDNLNLEKESVEISFAKQFSTIPQVLEILHDIEKSNRWTYKFIVLDCPASFAKEVLLSHVRDQNLGRRTFHYLITGYAFDENWDYRHLIEISSLNVTGFRIIDRNREDIQEYSRKWSVFHYPTSYQPEFGLSTDVAFVHDSLLVLKKSISEISKKQTGIFRRLVHPACSKNDTQGKEQSFSQSIAILNDLQDELRNIKIEGLSGNIEFNHEGSRKNFSLSVMDVKGNGSLLKIGNWRDGYGYSPDGVKPVVIKSYVCTTVLEAPFMQLKQVQLGEPELKGNDRYEGFFKDFADQLAERLNITYIIQISDGYGTRNASSAGGWTGMIGELVRNEADIGIGGLTANAAREHAVRLSKSVLFVGISIMLYKPERTWKQDIFAFMRPLSRETWICIGMAYFGVSVVLYLIAKFNEKELHETQKQGVTKLKPQFSMSNSLWFTFASLVGQGTDLCPRSISARLVGSVWWFLILIVTSSYTANFAAIQTVIRMETPINSAADLAAQSAVKYGYMKGGATAEFFRKTRITDYRKMAEFIDAHKDSNVATVDDGIARVREEKGKYAFLLESIKNKYTNYRAPCNTIKVGENLDTKGYVIGLSHLSGLSMTKINTLILEMREAGIVPDLEDKWLGLSSQCGAGAPKNPKDAGRLSLQTLIGVFYILIVGLLIALLIQLFEFWFNARKCSRNAKE